jgi:hypothetical protein
LFVSICAVVAAYGEGVHGFRLGGALDLLEAVVEACVVVRGVGVVDCAQFADVFAFGVRGDCVGYF